MTVNVITEPPATYLRRGNDVFYISGRSLAGQFGPVVHKSCPVIALYRWSLIAVVVGKTDLYSKQPQCTN